MAGYSQERLAEVLREDSGWEFFSPTQLGRLTGSCYLYLGYPERAEPILKPTAPGYSTSRPGGHGRKPTLMAPGETAQTQGSHTAFPCQCGDSVILLS